MEIRGNIKLKGISKRGKDRLHQHGNILTLVKQDGNEILVKSLNPTCKGDRWLGWFALNKDVEKIE